jgi:hypothetical protein
MPPCIVNLGARWRWVMDLQLRPTYHRQNNLGLAERRTWCSSLYVSPCSSHPWRVQMIGLPDTRAQKIFRPNREEVIGCWRKIRNEGLHNLYSRNVIMVIKIKKIETGEACSTYEKKWDMQVECRSWNHLKEIEIDEKMSKWMGWGRRQVYFGSVAGSCEHG